MAAPTPYALAYDFTAFQSANPTDPLPADKIEIEYNALQTTTDQLITNLGLIQRSDGALANLSVGNAQLKSEVTIGVNAATTWATATAYEANDTVYESNKVYRALEDHTSGTFATDLSATKWSEILDFAQFITATEGDVTSTESDLTATEADLSSVETDLAAVETDLSATESDLTATESDLTSTESDLTATEADLAAVEADLAGALPFQAYVNSRYYFGSYYYITGSSAHSVDTLYGVPHVVSAAETFTRIGIKVSSTGTATAARLGIYNMASGVPSTLVLDCGTVDVTGTGEKEVTISQALTAGIYALAVVLNGTCTLSTCSFTESGQSNHLLGDGAATGSEGRAFTGSHTYAALPSSYPSITYTASNQPALWLRVV